MKVGDKYISDRLGMLEAYAPKADETARQSGEAALHSSVRKARALLQRIEE
jgi:hypothetical protein